MRTAAVALIAALTGCEAVESSDVKTSGIWADMSATGSGEGSTQVSTILRVGGPTSNTFVDLVAGDAMTVSDGAVTENLDQVELGDFKAYQATLDGEVEDTLYTVDFQRTADTSAPASTMELPAPFDVTPPESAVLNATSELEVTWLPSGSGDEMSVTVTGDCVFAKVFTVNADPGTYTIDGSQLDPTDDQDDTSCDLSITVKRVRAGAVDPAYKGGTALGVVARSIDGEWQPS